MITYVLLTLILVLTLFFVITEIILRRSQFPIRHSDTNVLWCLQREKIPALGQGDVVLLGASRMLTDFDLEVFRNRYPQRKIIQLAISGTRSSYPIFRDIVLNTDFNGTVIIDEQPKFMCQDDYPQEKKVEYFYNQWTIVRKILALIRAFFQSRFVVFGAGVSVMNFWLKIVKEKGLPTPPYDEIHQDRSYFVHYDTVDYTKMRAYRMNSTKKWAGKKEIIPPELWYEKVGKWIDLNDEFIRRNGRVIFVRLPVSKDRFELENSKMPKADYWDKFGSTPGVNTIHFHDYPELSSVEVPDSSHLGKKERKHFTHALLNIIDDFELLDAGAVERKSNKNGSHKEYSKLIT